jgi:hypothetical protein
MGAAYFPPMIGAEYPGINWFALMKRWYFHLSDFERPKALRTTGGVR